MVTELTDKTLQERIAKGEPLLVDFWAPWCGPCRMLAPILEELSKSSEYQGKLNFGKINTDEYQEVAGKNDIQGIPCLILFHKGGEVDRIVGYLPKPQLKAKIDELLKKL